MNNINTVTIKQLAIAVGLARQLERKEICRVASCTPSYITRLLREETFKQLIRLVEALPADKDSAVYEGLGTLYLDIGRLIYSRGEKILSEKQPV